MVSFVALYRGRSLSEAELIAVSTDAGLVAHVAAALLQERSPRMPDAAVNALSKGKRRALKLIRADAQQREDGPGSGGRRPRS